MHVRPRDLDGRLCSASQECIEGYTCQDALCVRNDRLSRGDRDAGRSDGGFVPDVQPIADAGWADVIFIDDAGRFVDGGDLADAGDIADGGPSDTAGGDAGGLTDGGIPPPRLQLAYSFDELFGDVIDVGGVHDLHIDVAGVSGFARVPLGIFRGSLDTGAAGLNVGYVPGSSIVDQDVPVERFTVCAQVTTNSNDGAQTVYQLGGNFNGIALGTIDGAPAFAARPSGAAAVIIAPVSIGDGQPRHLCGVVDALERRLYVDGTLAAEASAHAPPRSGFDGQNIGQNSAAWTSTLTAEVAAATRQRFDGLIDDFRMYAGALGSAEIAETATTPLEGPVRRSRWALMAR